MIKAVIFDMDGLLINSEPFWRSSEIKVFGTVGLNLTEQDCLKTVGWRIDEVVEFWRQQHPWEGPSNQEIAEKIVSEVNQCITNEGEALPGVKDALNMIHKHKLPMAIASSSHLSLIEHTVYALGIERYFEFLISAETETYGKPHPGVYLTTAQHLNTRPEDCLVFEDSLAGLISAKAAKMKTVAIPEEHNWGMTQFSIADVTLSSMVDFDESLFNAFLDNK